MKLHCLLAATLITFALGAQTEVSKLSLLSYRDAKVYKGDESIKLDELKTLLKVSGVNMYRLNRATRQLCKSANPRPVNLRKLIEIPVGLYLFLGGGVYWIIEGDDLWELPIAQGLLSSGIILTSDAFTITTSKGYKKRAERNIVKSLLLYNYKNSMNNSMDIIGKTDSNKPNSEVNSKLASGKLKTSIIHYNNGQVFRGEEPISLNEFKMLLDPNGKSVYFVNKAKRQIYRSIFPIPVNVKKAIELFVGSILPAYAVNQPKPTLGISLLAVSTSLLLNGLTITNYEGYRKRAERNMSKAVYHYNNKLLLN